MADILKGDHGGTAFPLVFDIAKGSNDIDGSIAQADQRHIFVGMSLRDHFAAKAMNGLLATAFQYQHINDLAKLSFQIADSMLKARG